MRFLFDANMPRRSVAAIRDLGYDCIDVRDVGLGGARDSEIAAYARGQSLTLVSRDWDFADVRNYPPHEYQGPIVLQLPDDATAAVVTQVLIAFVRQESLLQILPSRLAIVEPGRVRLRPA